MIFATFIAMSSCVKKYTCHCVITYSGAPGLPDSTVEEYDVQAKKTDAETRCKGESGTFDNGSVHTVETCYLY
ncbi:MAG: hypothetical protein JWQ38_2011 [Flavipsychrobacter sp.]|nr:hypothetical protein [Flavipsychrobacter sp.]